jgi:serine/threonine-protein kinase
VLYEMITGIRAFARDTAAETMAAILKEEPLEIAASGKKTPPEYERIIEHALEKRPGERFQSARDFAFALQSISAERMDSGARRRVRVPNDRDKPSIAVLPFANMSPDPENEYFSDGITEEIISALAQQKNLRVAARTSCFAFKGQPTEIAEVGAKLNVATVLEGSVRKEGNRIRITAQLINVADGYHLWSKRFDRELHDVFEIQDETAAAIVEKLRGEFIGSTSGIPVKRYTRSREAHDMYLMGKFYWNRRDRGGLRQGLDCFKKAVEIDPDYALAYAGIADAYWSMGAYALHPLGEALLRGREAVEKALAIDEELASALGSKGAIHFMAGEWIPAEESFRWAIELDPRNGFAHVYYALFLAVQLRIEEMQEQIQIALEIDPLSHYHHGVGALAYWWAENHEESSRLCRKGLEIDPRSFLCSWVYGEVCCEIGESAEGIRYLESMVKMGGRNPFTLGQLGYALARNDQENRALELLAELEKRSSEEYVSPAHFGLIRLGLGDRGRAHEMYVRAMNEGLARHILVMFGRPFPDLLRRCGIPDRAGRD